MSPPTSSAERAAEAAAPEGQQPFRQPTPFLTKTYQIVDDPALDNIISWNEDGSTFIVWRPAELASEILPKLFKHNNFMSFLRQLNSYGFRKIVPDRWEFGNERFLRGERHLLWDIHRRKVPAASPPVTAAAVTAIPVAAPTHSTEEHVLSSNSSSGMAVPREENESERLRIENSIGLIEENERLRRENSILKMTFGLIEENERLRSENLKLKDDIGEMKGVCDRIMMLMSNYSASQQAGEVASELELMSSELAFDEVEGPAAARLFGVTIGAKRPREDAGDEREVAFGGGVY